MAIEITIPSLGEGIDGGDVLSLNVAVGDTVSADQSLFELETGKATVDVPAPADGVITRLDVKEGQKVAIGDVIGAMDAAGGTDEVPAEEAPVAAAPAPATEEEAPVAETTPAAAAGEPTNVDIVIPNLGEGVEGGDVLSIAVAVGDEVEEDQSLIELETGKATVDIPAPATGTITAINIAEGDKGKVGDVVGTMQTLGAAPAAAPAPAAGAAVETKPAAPEPAAPAPQPAAPVAPVNRPDNAPIPAAPSVRKFAREIGIDIYQVAGTGAKGRISKADVMAFSKAKHAAADAGGAVSGGVGRKHVALPDFASFGEIDTQPMNTIRKMTVEHMDNCWSTIPHVTQFDYADVTDIEALRKTFQPKAEAAGAKLTMTAMLMKIMGSALKAFPNFNASIDVEKEEIIYKKYFNVGCAVDTPKGLVVPVIKGIDGKNMIEISKELGDIAGDMREGKIKPAMLQGGCITLSNLGGLHGKHFTPIVNGPEVAILGVGRASIQPVWQNGEFVPRMMMPLSLSYDHRLIDGADGTRFFRWIIDAIEQPLLISLEG